MSNKIATFQDVVQLFSAWMETTTQNRLDGDKTGRAWFLKSIGFVGSLILGNLKNLTDRTQLNTKYVTNFAITDAKSRRGVSAAKIEISALYSFNKCVVERYKGRMHYYRDDLSQKGARNMITVGQSAGILGAFSSSTEN